MRFRLLGPLEFHDGARWRGLSAAKPRSLLAFLLLNAGRLVPPDRLADELWGSRQPLAATNLVQQYVMRVRRALGHDCADPVLTQPGGYRLLVGPGDLDTERFTGLLGQGQRALSAGRAEPAAAILTQALSLWRGEALADVAPTPAIEAEATRLQELRLAAHQARIDADLASGRTSSLVAELSMLVRTQPLREGWWGRLMLALYRSGRQAEALEAYRQIRDRLSTELAIEPGQDLARLHRQILSGDPLPIVPSTGSG